MRTATKRAFLQGARFAVVAAVVGPVLVFETWTADAFGLPKLAALWVAVLVALAFALAGGARLPWGRFATAVAVFVGVCALATLTSVGRVDSLFGSYERYGGMVSLLLCTGLALLVVAAFGREPDRLGLMASGLAAAAVLVGAYIVLQAAGIDFVDWREPSGAAVKFQGGTMGNSDFAGGFLGLAVPFLVWSVLQARGRARVARVAALVLDVAALGVTRSRGGILAAAAAGIALAWLLRADIPTRARRIGWVVVGAGALAAAVVVFVPGLAHTSGLNQTDLLRTESISARGREWAAGAKVFASRPILGTGPDTFEFRFARERSVEDAAKLGLQVADKPHNVLIEHATDTGVLGLAAYLAVVLLALRMAMRAMDGPQRSLLAVFVAGFVGYLAQAFVSIDVVPLAVTGWACLGAIAAISDPAVVGERTERRRRPRPKTYPVLACLVLVGVVPVVYPLLADRSAASAQRSDDRAAAAERWDQAIDRNPTQATYRIGAGFAAEAQGAEAQALRDRRRFLQQALDHYADARRLAPHNLFALLGTARTQTLWARGVDPGRFAEADRAWQRALAEDPHDWQIRYEHALMLNSWSNTIRDVAPRRRAIAEVERALRVKPGEKAMRDLLQRMQESLGANTD